MAKSEVKQGAAFSALRWLTVGVLMATAPSLLFLIAILLAPGWMCLILDRLPGRPVARASLLAGAAFCAAPVFRLIAEGVSFQNALNLLQTITVIALAWSGCAAGWLAAEFLPLGAAALAEAKAARRTKKLAEQRESLVEEWNLKD